MNAASKNTDLLEALANLERCLETPVVPGELEPWTAEVEKTTHQVAPLLAQAVETVHPEQFAEISEEDGGLFHKVSQLKEADQESLAKLDAFRQRLASLSEHAGKFEPDELRIEDRIEELIQQGLDLVIHIRKQEMAIETWLQEAFDRDRGVVD